MAVVALVEAAAATAAAAADGPLLLLNACSLTACSIYLLPNLLADDQALPARNLLRARARLRDARARAQGVRS